MKVREFFVPTRSWPCRSYISRDKSLPRQSTKKRLIAKGFSSCKFFRAEIGIREEMLVRKRQDSCVETLNVHGNLFVTTQYKANKKDKMKN